MNPLLLCAPVQPDGLTREEKYKTLIQELKLNKHTEDEWLLEPVNGESKLIEINISLLPPPNEKIAVSISRDITEKKKALEIEQNLVKKDIQLNALNHELNAYNLFVANKNSLLKSIKSDLVALTSNGFHADQKQQIQSMVKRIENNLENKQEWLEFKTQFQRIYPNFFKILVDTYPKLTENDLKHCAYMKMNLSLREVSDLMFVDKKAVEVARYRIKKKMDLSKEQKLKEIINSIA